MCKFRRHINQILFLSLIFSSTCLADYSCLLTVDTQEYGELSIDVSVSLHDNLIDIEGYELCFYKIIGNNFYTISPFCIMKGKIENNDLYFSGKCYFIDTKFDCERNE